MKTKMICVLGLLLFSVQSILGQSEPQFLIGSDINYGGFGGLMMEVSTVKNKGLYNIGGGGGALLNNKVFIGGYGMGNVSEGPLFNYNGTPAILEMEHGGLWLGYLHRAENIVHFGASTRFGWGGIELSDQNRVSLLKDDLFLLSPQAELEVNVLPFMKLNVSVGYRLAFGVTDTYLESADFSSPYGLVGFYFGWFAG